MAKKKAKRKAPSKKCESCGKGYHPASRKCPHCETANPAFLGNGNSSPKKTKAVKKSGQTRQADRGGVTLDQVKLAATLLKGCGDRQRALEAIKEAGDIRG